MSEIPYSLYLHIPFCRHRCAYCDFNTYAGLSSLIPEYCDALRKEIRQSASSAGESLPVHTVFFGGGTPSLLPVREISDILAEIAAVFHLLPGAEITLEANPGTVSFAQLQDLFAIGVNRLSFGVQSANPQELRLLEREHDFFNVIQAVQDARRAGFDNLNLDLIFGLPYQSLVSWQSTLDLVLGLSPNHLSLYSLTLEHGTPMQQWVSRGLLDTPDPDLAADMYELASQRLGQAGFAQYEISNWAAASQATGELLACRHNLQYWRGLPYIGLGAGAHGYADHTRTANVLSPQAYIQRMNNIQPLSFPQTSATVNLIHTTPRDEMGELMMMGLRLTREGVSEVDFQARFGHSLSQTYPASIERFTRLGLLEWTGQKEKRLRLTERGRLLGNQVFVEFI